MKTKLELFTQTSLGRSQSSTGNSLQSKVVNMKMNLHFMTFAILIFSNCVETKYNYKQDSTISPASCEAIFNKEIENVLFVTLGKDYVLNTLNEENKLYIRLTLDSLGLVVASNLIKSKILSKDQINKIELNLTNKKLCLINSDPHLTLDEFIRIGKNKYQYICQYPFHKYLDFRIFKTSISDSRSMHDCRPQIVKVW
jgi:hypothetical protein